MSSQHAAVPHVMPVRIYVLIWAALMVGTTITVAVAYQNLGPLNNIVCAVIWLFILIAFTLMDFDSRGWMGVPGK
jgi:hypothetical protein